MITSNKPFPQKQTMICEAKGCTNNFGYNFLRNETEKYKGWEDEPIFLCNAHSQGHEPHPRYIQDFKAWVWGTDYNATSPYAIYKGESESTPVKNRGNKLWYLIHNLIAHPLLITGTKWAERFHDWTADKI